MITGAAIVTAMNGKSWNDKGGDRSVTVFEICCDRGGDSYATREINIIINVTYI